MIIMSNSKKVKKNINYTQKTKKKRKYKAWFISFIVILISIICAIISIKTGKTIKSKMITLVIIVVLDIIYFITATIIKHRKMDPILRKKHRKRILKTLLLIFVGGFVLAIGSIIAFYFYIASHAPNFTPEALFVSEPSVLYDIKGNEIAKIGSEKRVIVKYDDLPEVLIDAIVATEDSKFFAHNGVDWARFLKASAQQLMGHDVSGASTLTMQISKNAYTSKESSGIKGIIRKFTDVYISTSKIEPHYSKEEILEFYVNSYFLGNNSYGVEQASLTYFGKSTKDLNLAEAAMIAGLFQAPGKYNPYTNPDATEMRRQTVLKLMLRHGYITKKEYDIASSMTVDKIVKPKATKENGKSSDNPYQAFVDMVVEDVKEITGDDPHTISMEIYTTMDPDKQDFLNGITDATNYEWENDVVQTGIAVTDINTGAIVAISGGRNYVATGTNRAIDLKNQIGSTAKPLYDYAPAIEFENWNTYSVLIDEPSTYSDGTKINNWDGDYKGFMTSRDALAQSRNIPALKTFKQNKKENIVSFVKGLGLSPESPLHEAHAIGGYNGESPLSMAAAYASFGNGGYYIKPYSFTKIIYKDTDEEYNNAINKSQAMSEETAYMMSDMLVSTAKHALYSYANINGVPFAAKTGTTNFDEKKKAALGLTYTDAINDYWVVGFNTEYAIAVWYGYDRSSSEYYNKLNSAQHLRLFQAVGKGFFTSPNTFSKPEGVVAVEIESQCPEAMLPSEYTPNELRRTELFVKGTEPNIVSPRFAKLNAVGNVSTTNTGNVVTLTWSPVSQPQTNNEEYLRTYYRSLFENTGYLNSFVSSILSYNNSVLGTFGYDVYKKENSGTLTHLGFTTEPKFSIEVTESGLNSYVIKTAYSSFKANASDGKSVSIKVTVTPSTNKDKPDTTENDDEINKDEEKDNKTNMGEVTYEKDEN